MVEIYFHRDLIVKIILYVKYVCTNEHTADILTKSLVNNLFKRHRLNMNHSIEKC